MNDRLARFFIVWMFIALQLFDGAEEAGPLLSISGSNDDDGGGKVFTEIVSYVGDEVTLHCDLTNVTGVIRWMRNERQLNVGNELDGSDRFHLGINQSHGHGHGLAHFLRIQGVRGEDDGLWHCQDVHDQQPAWILTSEPIRIIVLVPPTQPYVSVEEKRLPAEATFTTKEKNVLTFDCVTDKVNPAPDRVDWFLGDENLTANSRLESDFDAVERIYRIRSTLSLEADRTQHRKSLACHVRHRAVHGAVIARIVFNILYSPSFVISRIPDFGYPIPEGIDVSLKCDVNANPPSIPHWIKDDGPPPVHQSDDGYLNFTAISLEHAGWYRCSTEHEFGVFASFGYFLNVRLLDVVSADEPTDVGEQRPLLSPPQPQPSSPTQPEVQQVAPLGRTVMLECSADGKPPQSYCWARVTNGGRLESLVVEQQNFMSDSILYTDAGVYKCIVRNSMGGESVHEKTPQMRHNVKVRVTGKPVAEPVNRTLMALVGHPASFSVHFCANPEPSRIQWIAGNLVLNPGDFIDRFIASNISPIGGDSESNCYESTLDITEVRREDAGEFLFLVKNSRGIDDAEVLLNITQASFSVSSGVISWMNGMCFMLFLEIIVLGLFRDLENS